MPTVTRSYTSYIPNDNPLYAIPVQQGDVYNLSIAVTPERQGILGWYDPTANEMRCAVVPELEDCFTDDVVPSGDVRTIFDGDALSRTVWTGTIWIYDGDLYAFVSHYSSAGSGKVECYIANDVEDPTSWSLHGTVYNEATCTSVGPMSVREGGIPTVLDNGRWVLPFQTWGNFPVDNLEDYMSVSTSDDGGATWTTHFRDRQGPLSSGTAGPQSTTVAYEPASGNLRFGEFIGPANTWRVKTSSTGSGWSQFESGSVGYNIYFYMDDGTSLYAGLVGNNAMNLYLVDDPTDPTTWTDLAMRGIVSDSIPHEQGFQIIPLAWPTVASLMGVAFTARNRIAYSPLCEPVPAPPLFIPYKDRLLNLARDFTLRGIDIAIEHQFQNLKVIEQWAQRWMELATDADRCGLFIPFKDHSREEWAVAASQSFDNWKAIDRWASLVAEGGCGCGCASPTPPPERCRLFVPHQNALANVLDPLDLDALRLAGESEFDNFKQLERWANRYASGECGCSV